MKKELTLAITLLLSLPQAAWPGFEEGLDAYRKGDHEKAFTEYQLAVEEGDERALGRLGAMYLYGVATGKDYSQAYVWFSLANETGDPNAARFRDAASSMLTPAQLRQAEIEIGNYIDKFEKPQQQ
jgi:TPR repeat protein